MLGIFDGLDANRSVGDGVVMAQQVGQCQGAIDDQFRVTVEQTEEAPLAGHETRDEVHCFLRRPLESGAEFSASGGALSQNRSRTPVAAQASISVNAFR